MGRNVMRICDAFRYAFVILAANPVESAVHRFLWEAVRCEAHVRMDGHEAWGRGHRQSQEAPLNSYGWRSDSWVGTIVDTLETFEFEECVRSIYPERRIEWNTIDDDYTYNHSAALTWYGSVFKHPKRRHSWPHRPVVKGKESEAVRCCKLDDTRSHLPQPRYNWILVQVILLAGCHFNGVHP